MLECVLSTKQTNLEFLTSPRYQKILSYNPHHNYHFVVIFCDVYASVKPMGFSYFCLCHVKHIYALPTLISVNTQLLVGWIKGAILQARLSHRLIPLK